MMKLKELISALDLKRAKLIEDPEIRGISYHSQEVKKGHIFICIKGFMTDGHFYIKEAIENGALAIVVEDWQNGNFPLSQVMVKNSRIALAQLAQKYYDYPSRKIKLIGITGTNGKTTTCFLTESIFRNAGYRTGLLGTIHYQIAGKKEKAARTTPESSDLQRILAEMVNNQVKYSVMEVSSHALDLYRVHGSKFTVAALTNLSQDHLDYHKDMKSYQEAKESLFSMNQVQRRVLNIDDDLGKKLAKIYPESTTYGLSKNAQVRATEIDYEGERLKVKISTPDNEFTLQPKLKGRFNIYNILSATSIAESQGISTKSITKGIEEIDNIPGRFEFVERGQDFRVIIDYAHSPDSLENVLKSARDITRGRLFIVFGCGGDRDTLKRPLMGEVAAKLSDFIFITSDNPRSEEPQKIMKQIEEGIKKSRSKANYTMIENRKEAIFSAINQSAKDNTVIIAGKGHENYQIFKNQVIHFSDMEVAEEALSQRREK